MQKSTKENTLEEKPNINISSDPTPKIKLKNKYIFYFLISENILKKSILPEEINEGINGIIFSSKKDSNIIQTCFKDFNKNY